VRVPDRPAIGGVIQQPAVAEVADLAADQGVGRRLVPGHPADVDGRDLAGSAPAARLGGMRPLHDPPRTIPGETGSDGPGVRSSNAPAIGPAPADPPKEV